MATRLNISRSGGAPTRAAMVLLALLSGAANAADDVREQAMAHFKEGQKHFNLGEFDAALRDFREAYRLKDDPALLFNIGQSQFKLGDLAGALHSYRAYLRSSKEAPNRPEVERRISEIEKRIGRAGDGPSPMPPAAPPAAWPAAGSSEQAGTPPQLAAPSAPATPPPAPMVAAPAPPEPPPSGAIYTRWWFWTVVGVLVVGSAATAVAVASGGTKVPSTPLGGQRAF